ncbi:MAG: PEGA domain-containing protein [Chitinispirillaceae bacterium]|nr:PEGA domain-containing protein [Chitinispirillaceae bacterium]
MKTRHRMRYSFLFTLFLLSGTAASPFKEVTVAILDFEGAGFEANEIVMASDKFRASFVELSKYRMIEPLLMIDALEKQGLPHMDSGVCASKLIAAGKSLGVSYLLAGSFSRVKGITAVSARIIEVKNGRVVIAKSNEFQSTFSTFISSDIPAFVRDFTAAFEKTTGDSAVLNKKGILFIESKPENGHITINGTQTKKTTPATYREIDAGKHTVLVNSGKMAGSMEVTVTAGRLEKCIVALAPAFGSLRVQSSIISLPVTVSGKGSFQTPFQLDSLEPGEYTIESQRDGYEPYSSTVSVSALTTSDITIEPKQFSWLAIDGLVVTAKVEIDGIFVNMHGKALLPLPAGAHDIKIRRKGFKDGFYNVNTTPGDTAGLKISYTPLPSKLMISTMPPRAGIILNNSFKGRTPAIFSDMHPGHYSLMLTNRTHIPISRQLFLNSGATLAVQDTFKQFTVKYLEWNRRKKRLRRLNMVLAGMGRTLLKKDASGFFILGGGVGSDLIFGLSVYNYYSHNKESITARSADELQYFEDRETEDLVWAAAAGATSLFLRIFSSLLTVQITY